MAVSVAIDAPCSVGPACRFRPSVCAVSLDGLFSALSTPLVADVEEVADAAAAIERKERDQAARIRAGETLRAQTGFDEYLARRALDATYSFRTHLRATGGAIEE